MYEPMQAVLIQTTTECLLALVQKLLITLCQGPHTVPSIGCGRQSSFLLNPVPEYMHSMCAHVYVRDAIGNEVRCNEESKRVVQGSRT